MECMKYCMDWQKTNNDFDIDLIKKEYVRNCNRYIIYILTQEGYKNLSGVNINVSKEEMKKRLISSGVEKD